MEGTRLQVLRNPQIKITLRDPHQKRKNPLHTGQRVHLPVPPKQKDPHLTPRHPVLCLKNRKKHHEEKLLTIDLQKIVNLAVMLRKKGNPDQNPRANPGDAGIKTINTNLIYFNLNITEKIHYSFYCIPLFSSASFL